MWRYANGTVQRQPEVTTEVSERQLKIFLDGEQQYSTSIPNNSARGKTYGGKDGKSNCVGLYRQN